MTLSQVYTGHQRARVGEPVSVVLYPIAVDGLTLDLDSTVMTRYGNQEGVVRGYNPTKPGRPSHYPLMAFVADTCHPHDRQLLAASRLLA